MEKLAEKYGTTHATISRNTTGMGLTREKTLSDQFSVLYPLWQKEGGERLGFTEKEFLCVIQSVLIQTLGVFGEWNRVIEARRAALRKLSAGSA